MEGNSYDIAGGVMKEIKYEVSVFRKWFLLYFKVVIFEDGVITKVLKLRANIPLEILTNIKMV